MRGLENLGMGEVVELDHDLRVVVRGEGVSAELEPFLIGAVVFVLGDFAERRRHVDHAHLLKARRIAGLGVSRHRPEGEVAGASLALRGGVDVVEVGLGGGRQPLGPGVDQGDRPAEPAVGELEVVVLVDLDVGVGVDVRLEFLVLVVAEELAEDDRLVGEPELVVIGPGGVPDQVGALGVLLDPVLQEDDPLLDPLILVLGSIPLNRDVVGEVPPLEGPDRQEVGLELGDEVDGRRHLVPVLLPLQILGALPKDVGRDPARSSQEGELEHEAPGVDLADRGLAEIEVALALVEPTGVLEHRAEDGDDHQSVNDLAIRVESFHAATSRFFKMKYPAMENGKA